jgi:hypothetical protein
MCNIRSLFPRVHIEKKKKRTKLPLLKEQSSQLGSKIYRDVLKNHERRKKEEKNTNR